MIWHDDLQFNWGVIVGCLFCFVWRRLRLCNWLATLIDCESGWTKFKETRKTTDFNTGAAVIFSSVWKWRKRREKYWKLTLRKRMTCNHLVMSETISHIVVASKSGCFSCENNFFKNKNGKVWMTNSFKSWSVYVVAKK